MAVAGDRPLTETPTWAVAFVCAVFVIISLLIERGIHALGKWFQKRQKKAMSEALEKMKAGTYLFTLTGEEANFIDIFATLGPLLGMFMLLSSSELIRSFGLFAELMLLGFISLLLTVGTQPISKICIPSEMGDYMLPCAKVPKDEDGKESGRKLLSLAQDTIWRRSLAADSGTGDYCSKYNKVPMISQTGVHQLHIFIFVLAVFHVLYSVILMALGRAKMNKWRDWELETTSLEYQFTNDPARFRFAHQTSFVRRHTGFSRKPGIRWIVAFFRQFFGSINKVDYLTMRHGFINAHLAPNSKFDFHKYIKRSMEDDFKVVVGISVPLWAFAVIYLVLNVYNWYTLAWISFFPLIILLLLGMKLEVVIMEMAHQIQDRTTVVKGAPLVELSNKLFWFDRPGLILFLIHLTLFQNAFQMAYFLWTWYEFGLRSCFHENLATTIIRVVLGVALQVLCSYITFPLYALVTQMGSHMKQAIFEEQTAKALMKWRKAAKERSNKTRKPGADASSGFRSGENTPSIGSSPIHLLHKHKSNTVDIEMAMNSPRSYQSDTDFSETEPTIPVAHQVHELRPHEYHNRNGEIHSGDFSFVQP
ncbi:hypothetical protein IFM89_002429 [Coptis chinensis]|uniref:MLO-like protein n=1 Tax=Coptis chinensis TaxID=261450 RepID=A0A835IK98_9MAGN|nr:hypothetical protein IFM89_002429 [Coptis chinensis]